MNSHKRTVSPLAWVPSLYFAMGLPFVVLNMVSAVMFKDLGIPDAQIAFWTSLIMWPWTIKFLWSPFLELFRTKKFFVLTTEPLYYMLQSTYPFLYQILTFLFLASLQAIDLKLIHQYYQNP